MTVASQTESIQDESTSDGDSTPQNEAEEAWQLLKDVIQPRLQMVLPNKAR